MPLPNPNQQQQLPLFYRKPLLLQAVLHDRSRLVQQVNYAFARDAVAVPITIGGIAQERAAEQSIIRRSRGALTMLQALLAPALMRRIYAGRTVLCGMLLLPKVSAEERAECVISHLG